MPTTAAEQYLAAFHDRVHGATPRGIGRARTVDGATSYDVLLRSVSIAGARVLDVACGDGELLAGAARLGPAALFGIDIAAGEVDRARARLGPAADVRHEGAAALSLEAATVDVVLCHLALMLIAPLEPALTQMARVLRAGGSFAAVVQGRRPEGALGTFGHLLGARLQAEGRSLEIGDRRVSVPEDLRALLASSGFDEVSIEDFDAHVRFEHRDAPAFFDTLYGPDRLSDAGRAALYAELATALSPDADGCVPCTLPLRLVRARRA